MARGTKREKENKIDALRIVNLFDVWNRLFDQICKALYGTHHGNCGMRQAANRPVSFQFFHPVKGKRNIRIFDRPFANLGLMRDYELRDRRLTVNETK